MYRLNLGIFSLHYFHQFQFVISQVLESPTAQTGANSRASRRRKQSREPTAQTVARADGANSRASRRRKQSREPTAQTVARADGANSRASRRRKQSREPTAQTVARADGTNSRASRRRKQSAEIPRLWLKSIVLPGFQYLQEP